MGTAMLSARHRRPQEVPVHTGIVLIHADVARIPEVAQEVANIEGISECYSVTGDVDLIAVAHVREYEDLARVVADQLGKVEGVESMTTYIAFQTFNNNLLEQGFSVGIE